MRWYQWILESIKVRKYRFFFNLTHFWYQIFFISSYTVQEMHKIKMDFHEMFKVLFTRRNILPPTGSIQVNDAHSRIGQTSYSTAPPNIPQNCTPVNIKRTRDSIKHAKNNFLPHILVSGPCYAFLIFITFPRRTPFLQKSLFPGL